MAEEALLDRVHDLSDIELAVLLSLISREHCLISTAPDAIHDLVAELQLVAERTFGLQCAVINCTPSTTLEDFAAALLVARNQAVTSRSASPYQTRASHNDSSFPAGPGRQGGVSPLTVGGTTFSIANCILARNLDRAPQVVQIQALELLRTRRIFTRTAVQTAPKQFILIPILEAERGATARVTKHLNDFFFIAHWHDPEDGYVNLEDADAGDEVETSSDSSVLRRLAVPAEPQQVLITEGDISLLAKLGREVEVDVDVLRYQMNVVSFLRMHRAVAEGVTPTATKHFGQLMRCLAPLHRTDYVTPALVGLAARKVYLHRLRITTPEKERSVQWGSSVEAVKALLEGMGPEEVIEDVLRMVTAPA